MTKEELDILNKFDTQEFSKNFGSELMAHKQEFAEMFTNAYIEMVGYGAMDDIKCMQKRIEEPYNQTQPNIQN